MLSGFTAVCLNIFGLCTQFHISMYSTRVDRIFTVLWTRTWTTGWKDQTDSPNPILTVTDPTQSALSMNALGKTQLIFRWSSAPALSAIDFVSNISADMIRRLKLPGYHIAPVIGPWTTNFAKRHPPFFIQLFAMYNLILCSESAASPRWV